MDALKTLHAQYQRWWQTQQRDVSRSSSVLDCRVGNAIRQLNFEEFTSWWSQICYVPAVRDRWLERFARATQGDHSVHGHAA